jgi:hypothetical protein
MLKVKDWIQNPGAQFIPLMNTITDGVNAISMVRRIKDNQIFKRNEKVFRLVDHDKSIYCVVIYSFKKDLRGVEVYYWSLNPSGEYAEEMKFATIEINNMKVGTYLSLFKKYEHFKN